MRASNTCDGCALRRVRCDAKRPCGECQKRSLPCTTFRVKRKRGPKGPRQTTNNKVREFQRHLQESPPESEGPTPFSMGSPDESPSPRPCSAEKPAVGPALVYRRQPLAAYCRFLDVFRTRMYSVWPIVSCDALVRRLIEDEDDYESWTLAASVCAGVIAQLRLPEHHWDRGQAHPGSTTSPGPVSSHGFAADAEHFRTRYDYREQISVSSLLASFFLHIFYANDDRLRAAGLYMRESLTQAHILGLHRSDTYIAMPEDDRELCLRVYWVLFISERTYCVQHGLPPILRPISERPAPGHVPSSDHISAGSGRDVGGGGKYSLPGSYGGTYSDGSDVVRTSSSAPIASFLDLTRLFTFLDGDLIEPPSAITLPPPGLAEDDKEDRQTRRRVTLFQSDLDPSAVEQQNSAVGLDETQRVDIFVTRNWIRILLWEYSVRHFVMSSSPDDQAFSMVLPALVAHSMLGFFSTISGESIRAHGYGMVRCSLSVSPSLYHDFISNRLRALSEICASVSNIAHRNSKFSASPTASSMCSPVAAAGPDRPPTACSLARATRSKGSRGCSPRSAALIPSSLAACTTAWPRPSCPSSLPPHPCRRCSCGLPTANSRMIGAEPMSAHPSKTSRTCRSYCSCRPRRRL